MIWGLILKFIPPKYFECIALGDAPMTEEEKSRSFVSSLKPGTMGGKKEQGGAKKGKGGKGDSFQKAPAN